jgi:natural product precursor
MGSKKFSKKLSLSKKTIANLNNGEMKNVQGGTTCGTCACNTYGEGSCNTVCYTVMPLNCRPLYCA